MDTGGEHQITILCPKELAASSTNRGLYWLIGSPFLPPITVVSSLRCLHFQDNDPLSPDYSSESDSLRALVIRGFDVIGALCVGDAKREANAKRAVDAAMMLRKDFRNNGGDSIGVRSSCGVVGAGADLVSEGVSFYISESTGSSFHLRPIVSVTNCDGNADKFVWEKGCLLRCPVEFKLPLYVPEGKMSDAQKMLSSAMEDVITKLRDSQVAFLIEGINGTSKPIVLHGAEINLMHASDFNLHEHTVVETGKMALPCSHFIAKGKGTSAYNLRENADIIRVTVLLNKSRNGQNCYAPAAQFVPATSSPRLVTSSFKLDVLSYSSVDFPISSSISRLIVPGIIDQLITLSKAIGPNILSPPQLCPCHFLPQGILHPITAIYDLSYGETEMLQVEIRRSLHIRMGLPLDRPLLRMANALTFGGKGSSTSRTGSVIRDVHISIPRSGVSGGISSLVDGSYEYYHYLQDGLDDNGWGCAYRSLQTIISWFRLHHYTSLQVPLHREIQKTLVEIGDKDPSFVGSREWIGAIELSFVLDRLLGVSCKIINVRSGAELPEKCRELALHFKNQGTPIMIGGGVLAYTLLGVDYNGASGDCAFLILDPHYTGADDEKKIVSGGWCGWKKPVDSKGRNFFLNDKFYNLLLPQRPNMV